MSLAQLNCTEVSAIDTSYKNLVLRFENRIKCLNAVFWNIHQALDQNERTLLVLDRKEDLEYINYFLSKHHLKPLSIIINPKQAYLSPIFINNLNFKQELKSGASNSEKVKLSMDQLVSEIKSHLNQLRSPQLGKLNILDIVERNKLTPLQYQQLDLDLFKLIPFNKYKEKKALMVKAFELFKIEFNFKQNINPINTSFIIKNNAFSIQNLLSDFIDEVMEIHETLNDVRKQIDGEVSKDALKQLHAINTIVFKIKKYNNFEKFSESDLENLKILIDKFNVTCNVKIVPVADAKENIKSIEKAFDKYATQLNEGRTNNINENLKHINKFNAGEAVSKIFTRIEKLNIKLIDLQCLINWNAPVPCTLQSCNTIMQKLLEKLEYANFFLKESEDFFRWTQFINTLNPNDQKIIKCFTKVKSDWVEVFESNYLEGFVKSELIQLQDIDPLQTQLIQLLDQYEESFSNGIHRRYYNGKDSDILPAINGDQTKIAWSDFLEAKSTEMFNKFPLVIIDSQSFDKYAPLFEGGVDKTILINALPQQLPNQEWNKNILTGYTSQFNKEIVKHAKHFKDAHIQNYTGVEFNVNRSIRNMNVSEINMLSLYLGQAIHKLNDNYKIFQLKDKAIVSFLKDDKNAELLHLIGGHGAKEIFTIEDNYNLLPGVLANPDSETVFLLEDNLIAVNPDDFDLRQLILIDKIKTSGFKVVSVNNFKLLTDNNYTLTKIINNLLGHQGNEVPVTV